MGLIRTIKPEFFTSPNIAAMSVNARLLYIAMWTMADDWGVGDANPVIMGATAFPYDEKIRKEIPCLCKEIANNVDTVFFTNQKRAYFQILSWEEHQRTQRRAKRRYPTVDDAFSQVTMGGAELPCDCKETPCECKENARTEQRNRGTEEQRNKEQRNISSSDSDESNMTRKELDEAFDTFWSVFPSERKRSKTDCRTKFRKAVKNGTPAEDIIRAAAAYANDPNREPEYTVNPLTWLREERWDSGPLPARASNTSQIDQWAQTAQQLNQQPLRAIEGGNRF